MSANTNETAVVTTDSMDVFQELDTGQTRWCLFSLELQIMIILNIN